jgi:hypothetical protein
MRIVLDSVHADEIRRAVRWDIPCDVMTNPTAVASGAVAWLLTWWIVGARERLFDEGLAQASGSRGSWTP